MRRSLISLLSLIALWSLYYLGIKYFFWSAYSDMALPPSLESISGFILIGSMLAYILGGPLYARFSERIMLFVSIIVGILFMLLGAFFPRDMMYLFDISMIGTGFAYSLYVIGKNTLIGREISTSPLGSATIGAFSTVILIVFFIIGSYLWSRIWETDSWFMMWVVWLALVLLCAFCILFFANTRRERIDFHFSLSLYKRLLVRYGIFMIALACFWQISSEASQVAIKYSIEYFHTSESSATLLLAFSAIGAILGNIVSVKLANKRLWSFFGLTLWFVIILFLFSSLLGLASTLDIYPIIQGLAFIIGFFFGGAVNLAESYFLSLLGRDPDESHISALYGFTLSFVGAITMFISERILHSGSYVGISIFLGFLALVALYGWWRGIQIEK